MKIFGKKDYIDSINKSIEICNGILKYLDEFKNDLKRKGENKCIT